MKTYAIGLMSGTSLDGLDICYASFEFDTKWHFEILEAQTIPYPVIWENRLKSAFNASAMDLFALSSEYGFYLGKKVQEFILKNNLSKIDVVASHGHTVFHQPDRQFTTQIGDGRAIKLITNLPTVYDFRTQDVLMGGNGAPLVPIGDELLFSDYDACINLGGFSNISFKKENQRIAFDICPVNIVLNKWSNALGFKYDENGFIAANTEANHQLLEYWNALNFYQSKPPKSLGVEWLNKEFLNLSSTYTSEVLISTATLHAAIQITETIKRHELKNVLFTGGGSYNSYLIETIQKLTSSEIILPDSKIIDFKEALIFAFMGVLKINNQNNVLASATGAFKDHCTGILA